MPDIHELDPTTIERIAAGEVVERPASVVKELVENSIDADASRVDISVAAAGTEGIRVADDGRGMTGGELRLAVEKHTTSKITDIDDLETGVSTLGFRGEALHAIGAVSRLTVRGRRRGTDTGTELVVEGGDVVSVEPVGCPEGTVVEVDELFHNVPARRKYLKTEATEFDHVNRVVTGYALANPDVAVTLEHDGRETFSTTGSGDLRETVMAVYGREVASAMIPVDAGESALPPGPLDAVEGLVSHPETNRSGREYLSTFVNGRYVTASVVREAVVDAYGTQLASNRYPFAVLDITVPPETIDVNVHPRKLEVRFADEAAVRDQVESAVREALLGEGLVRSSAARGRSAPDETEVSPERDVRETDTLSSGDDGPRRAPGRWRDETADTELDIEPGDADVPDPDDREPSMAPTREPEPGRYQAGEGVSRVGDAPDDSTGGRTTGHGHGPTPDGVTGTESGDGQADSSSRKPDRFESTPSQATLDGPGDGSGDATDALELDRLPEMRVLGQLRDTYLVAETPDGLVLVDQHAADERVNYERLRERFAGDVETQALAEPVDVTVTPREAALAEEYGDALARLGFRVSRVDADTADHDDRVRVRTVPALLADEGPELVRDLLSDLAADDRDPAATVEAAVEDLLGDMACHPSVTGNTSLTEGSVVALLEALDDCENPYACPHGRPVVVEIGTDELDERFERDYPGHGGRRDR